MTRRDTVLVRHREAIRAATARNRACSIALVGSVARGDDTDASDYDFLPEATLFDVAGLQIELGELLDAEVDVVYAAGLKDTHRGMTSDAIVL